jgi:FlgD Ig-like domain
MRRNLMYLFMGITFALLSGNATADVVSIYDIQSGLMGINEGDEVTVEDVVVTASGYYGFFVQEIDESTTWGRTYSGIFVHTHNNHLGIIQAGDRVNVHGIYTEYYGLSEIDVYYSPCGETVDCSYEIVGTAAVPDPVLLPMTDINTDGVYGEAYESVLVKVDEFDTTLFAGQPDGNSNWMLYTDGVGLGDSIMVNQRSADPEGDFFYVVPDEGDEFSFVSGVLIYDWNDFKISPRSCLQDLGGPCPPDLVGVWATSNSSLAASFALDVDETSAEDVDNYIMDSGLLIISAERDASNYSIVHLTTEPQTPGYIEIAYVDGVLSDGDLVVMNSGEFTFAQGLTPLEQIQDTGDPEDDASPFLDYVVTVTGRVAHTYGNYYFLQEGDAGPYKHLYSRVSKNGPIARGDSVMVSGVVEEYYGSTNLGFASGVVNYQNFGPAVDPIIVTDVMADEIIYSCSIGGNPPDDNRAEPWEDALIRLNQPAYVDSVNGAAELYGEWWMLVSPDSVKADLIDERNGYGDEINYDPAVGDTLRLSGLLLYQFYQYTLLPRDRDDIEIIHSEDAAVDPALIDRVRMMLSNSPNPFRNQTAVRFLLPGGAKDVSIDIFDVTGAKVRTLLDDVTMSAGEHTVYWDGFDNNDQPAGAGTYFYRLEADGNSQARQMIMLK